MISVVVNAVITDEITSGEEGENANDHVHIGYELGFYSDPCTVP